MFLRNFYITLALQFFNYNSMGEQSWSDGNLYLRNVNAGFISASAAPRLRFAILYPQTSSGGTPFITFGTGTTPVDYDDYKLASAITSTNLTASNFTYGSYHYNPTTRTYSVPITCILSNNSTSTSYTIKEVGIGYYYSVSSSNNGAVLYYREVLEEPFTIMAGESLKYTHTIEFTMPDFSASQG